MLEANHHKTVDELRASLQEEFTCIEAFKAITAGQLIKLDEMRSYLSLSKAEMDALYRRINDRLDY